MHLKQKIFYISIGAILLAVFQVGFHLLPRFAFADSHQAHETANKPQPVKTLNLINYPLGGKSEYLEWVKEIGPSLVTEEVARVRSYDNFEGTNPIGWSRLNLTVLRICKNFNAAVRSRLFCKI